MYRTYLMEFINNREIALLAKNNREAMALAGRAILWYGDIVKVTDDKGVEVVNNKKIFGF